MIKNDIFLPDEMEKDREILEKTLKKIIFMETERINDVEGLPVTTSKFGGNPYFPKNADYPKNENGVPLSMLAQINFNEIFTQQNISEELEQDSELKYLPRKGILSFFIDYYDDVLGSDFGKNEKKTGYRVMYFPEIEDSANLISDFRFLDQKTDSFYPVVDGEYKLSFQILDQMVTMESCEWEKIIGKEPYDYLEELNEDSQDEVYETYNDAYSGGHQIGGYPFFTQWDPRAAYENLDKYNFLLFQLDSDFQNKKNIMWGDAGIGNFFINIEDLKKLDFSNVLYTWDCS